MNTAEPHSNPSSLVMEIRSSQWTGRWGDQGFVIDLQRDPKGVITETCREEISQTIRKLAEKQETAIDCLCTLGGSGVSLRTLEVPSLKNTSLSDLIELQIEKEWPLPPDELVWAFHPWDPSVKGNTDSNQIRVTIAAVRRSQFSQYESIAKTCNLNPTWTLSACLAAENPLIATTGPTWLLDVRETSCDWVIFDKGVPETIRQLPVGTIQEGPIAQRLSEALQNDLTENHDFAPLVVAVKEPFAEDCARELQQQLPDRTVHLHAVPESPGFTFTTHTWTERTNDFRFTPQLILKTKEEPQPRASLDRGPLLRWVALLGLLVIAILVARRVEPTLRGNSLNSQLTTFKAEKQNLPEIDRELDFLSYIHEKSLPFEDIISLLAANAVPQFEIQSLEMGSDRRVQLRGTLPERGQPEDLRTKLFDSGWFEQVVLDEQTPNQRERKLTIRISMVLKPPLNRPKLAKETLGLKPNTEEKP